MSVSTRCGLGLGLLSLATSACALTGYDFGDYERAAVSNQAGGSSGASGTGGQSGGTETGGTETNGPETGGTETNGPSPFGVGLSAGGDRTDGGAGGHATAGGADSDRADDGGAGGHGTACEPQSCFDLGLECGPAPSDGCGQTLDCGGCFWWFQECHQNHCEIPE